MAVEGLIINFLIEKSYQNKRINQSLVLMQFSQPPLHVVEQLGDAAVYPGMGAFNVK